MQGVAKSTMHKRKSWEIGQLSSSKNKTSILLSVQLWQITHLHSTVVTCAEPLLSVRKSMGTSKEGLGKSEFFNY